MLTGSAEISQPLLADLRTRLGSPELCFAAPPRRIESGAENTIAELRLAGAPENLSGGLILRLYRPDRDPVGIRFEAAIHEALAAQGYPAPRVHVVCDDPGPLGAAYMLMDLLPGRLILGEVAELDAVFASLGAAARRVPRMIWDAAVRGPRELGSLMALLHTLDTKRIVEAVERAGFRACDFTLESRLDRLQERAVDAQLDGLADAFDWLRAHHRPTQERVLCHSDFHVLNVLVLGRRVTGVLDWSWEHLCFAEPAYDVGNTRALFDITLPGIPRAVRPVLDRVQRRLRDGFTRHYARHRSVDPARVRWAEVYRYVREMVSVGENLQEGVDAGTDFLQPGENPWMVPAVRDGVLAGIRRRTGVAVSLPGLPAG